MSDVKITSEPLVKIDENTVRTLVKKVTTIEQAEDVTINELKRKKASILAAIQTTQAQIDAKIVEANRSIATLTAQADAVQGQIDEAITLGVVETTEGGK